MLIRLPRPLIYLEDFEICVWPLASRFQSEAPTVREIERDRTAPNIWKRDQKELHNKNPERKQSSAKVIYWRKTREGKVNCIDLGA